MPDPVYACRFTWLFFLFFADMASGQFSMPTDTSKSKSSFTTVFEGQPGRAALYSLILPGAGQIYNKRYWKVPLVLAGEGFALYNLLDKISTFQNFDQCYISLIEGPPVCENLSVSQAFNLRRQARSNKEYAWLLMGGAHLLNVLEAFVDRHLINFDTSEQLSLYGPPQSSQYYGFNELTFVRIRFRINPKSKFKIQNSK